MADNDFLRQTLTYYREQRQRILEQLRPLDPIIRQLETELGENPADGTVDIPLVPLVLPAVSADGASSPKPSTNNKQLELRGDEFFGKSQADAARAYLITVGHAVPLEEILQGLTKGGCHVGGTEPIRTLYVSLLRNTRDFCKLPNGLVGLRSMYPDLRPGAGTSSKPKQESKRKKQAAKKKRTTSTKAAPRRVAPNTVTTSTSTGVTDTPAKQPIPIKATVKEVLADGQFQNSDAIVQRVQEKVGMGARSFTILGVLNKTNDFERDGDRFRLKT